jgi:hypothetical protein
MPNRYDRFAPLTGVAWAILAVVAVLAGGGETPEGNASAAKVVSYYSSHSSEIKTSAVFFVLAFLFFLLFCSTLRAYLRRGGANEPLATLLLAGGVIITVTAGILGGVELGLAKNIHHLGPEAAQAVSLVSDEGFLPVLIGGFLFSISAGLAILRGGGLPRWLGWVAIVMAIVFVIPPVVIAGLILLILWSLVVGVLMFKRWDADAPASVPVAA